MPYLITQRRKIDKITGNLKVLEIFHLYDRHVMVGKRGHYLPKNNTFKKIELLVNTKPTFAIFKAQKKTRKKAIFTQEATDFVFSTSIF